MEPMTILVVDPQPTGRTALAKLLRADGHLVIATGNWTTAQQLASNERFDVLITELSHLQRHDRMVMRRLSDRCETLGILLTAHDEQLARGWKQAGFSHYLYKPVGYDRIRSLIARHSADRSVAFEEATLIEQRELCHS